MTATVINIRPASMDDALDVLRWRNDWHTRAMSTNCGLIEEATHLSWFERALNDENRVIVIGTQASKSIGMVRFDRLGSENDWIVSITLAPEERGKGLSKLLLAGAMASLSNAHPHANLLAEVKVVNTESKKLFESLGYLTKNKGDDSDTIQFAFGCHRQLGGDCTEQRCKKA